MISTEADGEYDRDGEKVRSALGDTEYEGSEDVVCVFVRSMVSLSCVCDWCIESDGVGAVPVVVHVYSSEREHVSEALVEPLELPWD